MRRELVKMNLWVGARDFHDATEWFRSGTSERSATATAAQAPTVLSDDGFTLDFSRTWKKGRARARARSRSRPKAGDEELPLGWVEYNSPRHGLFYFNTRTKQSQFERPV